MNSGSAIFRARGIGAKTSDFLFARKRLLTVLLLALPLGWIVFAYLASLLVFLSHVFFSVDEFSGVIRYELTTSTLLELVRSAANLDIVARTVSMAAAVTLFDMLLAFALAYYMRRQRSEKMRAVLYLAVMMPLWSSYLVRVYAWKLLLAKEGAIVWATERLGLGGVLDAVLAVPMIGGPSLSISYLGMFLVFSYIWLPFMVLPVHAALERVPDSLLEASADLGGGEGKTVRHVVLPLALPGLIAGSIFTFSLTLGDYIIPYIIGNSRFFIGQAVYVQQGTAGNIPLAAAFTLIPIIIMALYLFVAKRLGAFQAL
ncbi:MAG: ABC transporter permease [Gammaproteobacteria bacterium]|nr:ABC transporter permease [Gammaproteobacteria bacterium]